jgi:hypothetical protein
MGELQQKILNHFFNCSYDSETIRHLSRTLGVSQPAIFKNVNLIKKNKYLAKGKKFSSEKKKLFVTDKAAAAAVLLGITLDKLHNYFKKLSSETPSAAEQVRYLEKLRGIFRILPYGWLSTNHSVHPCRYQTSSSSIVSTNMQPISRHVTHSREQP